MTKHKIDRSRHVAGFDCPTKRYWLYHHKGLGIQSKNKSIDLWTGGLVHKMLEMVLVTLQLSPNSEPSKKILRIAVARSIELYKDEPQPSCAEFTFKEQVWLAECLVWGWIRTQMAEFIKNYEIVAIEREMPLELPNGIVYMNRPDLVLRSKATKKLSITDWKTSSYITDEFIQEFQHSPQMAGGTLAAEKHLGEPVESYLIFALIKGSRKFFTKGKGLKAISSPEKRTYSNFCYAKYSPPMPPLTTEPTVDLSGFWLDKTAAWELDLECESGQSRAEKWIWLLPLEAVLEQYLIIGPYPRQDFMMQSYLDSIQAEEARWIQVSQDEEKLGSELVLKNLPKSFKCHSYGSLCQFYNLCFKVGSDWKDPLSSGNFEVRKPHHEDELGEAND